MPVFHIYIYCNDYYGFFFLRNVTDVRGVRKIEPFVIFVNPYNDYLSVPIVEK